MVDCVSTVAAPGHHGGADPRSMASCAGSASLREHKSSAGVYIWGVSREASQPIVQRPKVERQEGAGAAEIKSGGGH